MNRINITHDPIKNEELIAYRFTADQNSDFDNFLDLIKSRQISPRQFIFKVNDQETVCFVAERDENERIYLLFEPKNKQNFPTSPTYELYYYGNKVADLKIGNIEYTGFRTYNQGPTMPTISFSEIMA